jgi:hypothetical protein
MTTSEFEGRSTLPTVVRFWVPLAASWLLMAVEWPLINAFIARLPEPRVNLAAQGIAVSVVLALQAPSLALLTASNALVRDRASYCLLRRFTLSLGVGLTVLTLLVGFTPLFNTVVIGLIGAPADVAAEVRLAMRGLALWPLSIGYRRFYQGLLIRHGHTRVVGYGTLVRLSTSTLVGSIGLAWGHLEGATVGGLALGLSATAEALFVHFSARSVIRAVQEKQPVGEHRRLTLPRLLSFFLPLSLTSLLGVSTGPLISFGLSRSASPIASLAAWPVVDGQLFVLRSFGLSLQEVVVALLNGPTMLRVLRRFSWLLGVGSTALLLLVALTPLAPWWQATIAGLDAELTGLAVGALQVAAFLPALAVLLSFLRGVVITGSNTGAIAQATAINLVTMLALLLVGAEFGWMPGASLAAFALTMARIAECAWLWHRARPRLKSFDETTAAYAQRTAEQHAHGA